MSESESDDIRYLIGVRLREPLTAEDYLTLETDLHVGEFCVVETGGGTAIGEVRRPKRPLPDFKRDRLYRKVVRRATDAEAAEWRERRQRELRGVETAGRLARTRNLPLKIVDVAIDQSGRRHTVSFNSEERGPLMGSWGYTEAPSVPLDRTVAMINMDMIGRNEEVPENGGPRFRGLPVQTGESNKNSTTLLGWSRSASLTAAVERANARYKLTLKKNYDNNASQLLRRSDSWAFLQHGVPAVWFHNGLHPDYHLTSDTPDRLNYEKMERIAKLVHQLSWNLAQASERPTLTRTH